MTPQMLPNKTVVDNRLPAPSRNDPRNHKPLPCSGVALPVAGATPRRSAKNRLLLNNHETIPYTFCTIRPR
jgi:hypothetical protein